MSFIVKKFDELTLDDLYQILRLRSEVFVVEQDCVYQDIDNKDQISYHVLKYKKKELIAYARIFDSGDYFDDPSIGRIIVKKSERKANLGFHLVEFSIQYIEDNFSNTFIEISAQCYLIEFYSSLGFKTFGEEYLEDGIPHIRMLRTS